MKKKSGKIKPENVGAVHTHTHTHTHTSSLNNNNKRAGRISALKTISKNQKTRNKQKNNIKKPIDKKIIISISILIILILIGTLVVFAFSRNQENTVLQAEKTELNLEDNEYMHVEKDASGDKVAVPNGYVGSNATGENEIDNGYVIYEGEEVVTDSNVADAQKSRNQYVWVPVPDISKFYGTDANGKKWGKLYSFATSSTNSSYDEITGTYPNNWSEDNGVMIISSKTGRKEPDVTPKSDSTGYDIDSRLKTLGLGANTTHEFLIQLEQEFNNMIESVEKYGGFYIGRYETGNLDKETAVVQKGNTNISLQNWYTMYKKCKTLKGQNINIETGMIWGNQFDRTLMWLVESGNKTKEEICKDSVSWANYSNATFEYVNSSGNIVTKNANSRIRIPTGSTEYTKANNIYDLAGNIWEWTMEELQNRMRVARGAYYSSSSSYTANSRYKYAFPLKGDDEYGCRAILYIK